MSIHEEHYLKKELYELIQRDPSIFDFLQSGSLDGLWYWDLEHPENEWMNSSFWELLGYGPAEKKHLASEWQDLINQDDLKIALENFKKHCANPDHPYDQVVRYRHKNGHTVWVRRRGVAIRDASGKAIRMLGTHNDVTELKSTEEALRKSNERLSRLASRDHLTTLYNRLAFEEHLKSQLLLSIRERRPISLAMIDIDHFKTINDKFGHQKGDEILHSVALALKEISRESDILARYGGEEFAVIIFGADKETSTHTGERYREAVHEFNFKEQNLTVSIGVATNVPNSHDESSINIPELSTEIVRQADMALYIAKANGRDQVRHYEEEV